MTICRYLSFLFYRFLFSVAPSWCCILLRIYGKKTSYLSEMIIYPLSHILQLSLTNEKLDDITGAVLAELRDSCHNCAITSSTIDEEYFACDSESPTYVTYRARLEGTSETDSGSLIPLIEAWARSGPNITAGGLLTVNSQCPVSISSLTDPEEGLCEYPPTTAPDEQILSIQNIAIIAGVGGGILLIFVVFLVIGLRLCCKYSCRPKPSEE